LKSALDAAGTHIPAPATSIRTYTTALPSRVAAAAGTISAHFSPIMMRSEEIALGVHPRRDDELLDWYPTTQETYHSVGICKIGGNSMAIVDYEPNFHGLSGLRVADVSIMPPLTSGNANAPFLCSWTGKMPNVAPAKLLELPSH
jgi:choline dehydrogenase-like flavoprotein